MSKKWAKIRKIDRSSWGIGPWNNEPDFFEWDTLVGYPAYASRLETGAWYGVVIAPYPTDKTLLHFCHYIDEKYYNHGHLDHQPGMISKTDQEGIGEHSMSMEHYQSPSDPDNMKRGPYKTLEDVKQICENAARYIFETLRDGEYKKYFD